MPQCPQCKTEWGDDVLVCPEDGTRLAFESAVTFSSVPLQEEPDPLLGSSVGSYQIIRLLGSGGMGAVYLAEHPVIRSRVAVKFLHPQYTENRKVVDRFFNEARAVNLIGHDNILKILDLNITPDGRHYFVMELLEGQSLQALVEQGKPVPLSIAGPILLQFCEALQAAHDRQIFHRDVKPENVYLIAHKGRKNFVKVVDFGVAKLAEPSPGRGGTGTTQTGMVVGTPSYMSPEQAGGVHQKIDARSDIYSTGVMMFQLATGALPFPSENFGEVLVGHMREEPPHPRALKPELPVEYEQVILQALAKSQDARQQSMQELAAQIAEVMNALRIPNELPIADLSVSSPEMVRLVPSQPGAARHKQERPRFREAQVVERAAGELKRSGQTLATRIAPLPTSLRPAQGAVARRKSIPPLLIGVGAIVLVIVVALVASAIFRAGDPAKQRARKSAVAAVEPEPAPGVPVLLSIVSEPLGATVDANWHEGAQSGRTPFDVRVPPGTKVTLVFHLAGYAPYRQDVIADEAQVVTAQMQSDGTVRPARPRPAEKPRREQSKSDDVIDVANELK